MGSNIWTVSSRI